MITNLFSMFDPSTSFLALNWSNLLILMSLPLILLNNINNSFYANSMFYPLDLEISASFSNNNNNGSRTLFLTFFLMLLTINFSSLFPFIFSSTAQIIINFPLAISFWLSLIMFSCIYNLYSTISHLLPTGTPYPLIPLIVLIEIISNLIRPITLSVRLTANIIAGHLLISLLANFLINLNLPIALSSSPLSFILSSLEMAVSAIQSYVFITLLSLYASEN